VYYELKPIVELNCGIGACPRIYKVIAKHCGTGMCPQILETLSIEDSYIIVGTTQDAKALGLEAEVGTNEAVVSVPKSLIDKLIEAKR
jgi:hypothetical protein